ncbi:MAG: hypothetical protein ACFFC1_07550 [Promethearchaeota archaeon]
MSDQFTIKNHYNPCFWTACWNYNYYQALLNGNSKDYKAREQEVHILNLKTGKILKNKVENIHFDKKLGVAEITPETLSDFYRRNYPLEYVKLRESLKQNTESVYFDFEDILTGMENSKGYDALMEIVVSNSIKDVHQKGFLTCQIILQAMRSHEMMNSMIKTMNSIGMPKWEYLWILKNAWSNVYILYRATRALAFSQWILYVIDKHMFPLCDSPVMINENTLMMTISPRLLLEINLNQKCDENDWIIRRGISKSKYWGFRRRSIQNSFKDIIFHDPKELENWRNTREFKIRSEHLRDRNNKDVLIADAAKRVIGAINGFGKIPDDFELRLKEEMESIEKTN